LKETCRKYKVVLEKADAFLKRRASIGELRRAVKDAIKAEENERKEKTP
jgi:hypothetical protein